MQKSLISTTFKRISAATNLLIKPELLVRQSADIWFLKRVPIDSACIEWWFLSFQVTLYTSTPKSTAVSRYWKCWTEKPRILHDYFSSTTSFEI